MCAGRWSASVAEPHSYLARASDRQRFGWVKRFRPALWTVDFARPMMGALTVPGTGTLRMDLDFLTRSDLAGLIWGSEDRWSHPLLSYSTDRDYRGCRLSFEWAASAGVMPLDAVNGAVLTVEGRDENGSPRTWYVRLWNYAEGSGLAARVALDLGAMRAGFGRDGEPVFAGDVDRIFISVVHSGFDGSGAALPSASSAYVELRDIRASGPRSTLKCGDAFLPEHRLRMASGYDDSYHQTPERLVEQWQALGYRDVVNHYVGMSHFPALAHVGEGRFEVSGGLCASAEAWHRGLLRAATAAGMEVVLSLSLELFDAHAPAAWTQRDVTGARALTGWEPPSTLISPCSVAGLGWLKAVAGRFAGIAASAGGRVLFQIGEPWWWVGSSGKPCFYDAATTARWTLEKGAAPPAMQDAAGNRSVAERTWLDWLGARLSEATEAVRAAAEVGAGGAQFVSHLLFYAPQVLDGTKPDLARANMPVGWNAPAFDVLQLEDYDFVTAGDEAGMQRARKAVSERLGYVAERQHYLAGFVLSAENAGVEWPRISGAAAEAMREEVSEVFVWAWPQISRDGFAWTEAGEEDGVEAFHDVRFPLDVGFDAVGGPEFQTQVAMLASGHEQRNQAWAQARLSYDAGLGVRSEQDLVTLTRFFRGRRGRAFAFRFRDPMDWMSAGPGEAPRATDQLLGVGDGMQLSFQLVKRYGDAGAEEVRRISRPEPGSVRVSVAGVELFDGWQLLAGGRLVFDEAPPIGAAVRAGYAFDVPVRFASDRLDVSLSGVRSGEAPSVPLVEVRE